MSKKKNPAPPPKVEGIDAPIEFRFLHSSDWHFGATRNLTPGSTEYLVRHRAVLEKIVEYVQTINNKIDFVLVSGDVFENKGTTIPEFLLAYEIFERIGKYVPVIVTAGNHDELGKGEFQTFWLDLLNLPNVHFVSKPQNINLAVRGGNVGILAMPWTGIKDQDQFDKYVMENCAADTQIIMLHECFQGSILDNGRRFPGGVGVPDIPDIRYFACGDIHKCQQLNIPHAWFSGAPLQYTFGDHPDKGFLVVTSYERIVEMRVQYERIVSPVELITTYDPKQVDPESPHWYSLYCQADQIPLEVPANLKKINPLPVKIDMPEATTEDGVTEAHQIRIDYAEGVDQIMGELGYGVEDIQKETEHIRNIARV